MCHTSGPVDNGRAAGEHVGRNDWGAAARARAGALLTSTW